MNKERIENILNELCSTGAEFVEAFLENKTSTVYTYTDNKLDKFEINKTGGIGLRVSLDDNVFYAATNDFSDDNINKIVLDLKSNFNSKILNNNIKLNDIEKLGSIPSTHYSNIDIKNKLKELNDLIRSKDNRIIQVNISLVNVFQNVVIANNSNLYKSEDRMRSRIFIVVNFQDNEKIASVSFSDGKTDNYDFLDNIDFSTKINELIKTGIDKLYAKPCIGKEMPVIIGPGFGGVIFHEACGHAMEATAVKDHLSVLSDDLGNKIASDKVTIIDDGTINNFWGTTIIDDEGMPTQKNVLIEDGYLKSFLVDNLNSKKMNHHKTGSGRRESYMYAPTSRMNNTYLKPGTDKIDDMIKSIDLGLYAMKMGGGCVSPETGDFNFAVDAAYMIRDGKICEPVKSASLIGNTKEILQEIEMVSDNLELAPGMCGSISGWVPVCVGEPTIKVRKILVGGEDVD